MKYNTNTWLNLRLKSFYRFDGKFSDQNEGSKPVVRGNQPSPRGNGGLQVDGEPAERSREQLGGGSEEGRRRRGVFGGDLRRQQCPPLHRKTQPG